MAGNLRRPEAAKVLAVPTQRRRPRLDEPRLERDAARPPDERLAPLFFADRPAADFLEVAPAFLPLDAAPRPELRAPVLEVTAFLPARFVATPFRALLFRAPPVREPAAFRELFLAVPLERLELLLREELRAPVVFEVDFFAPDFFAAGRAPSLRDEDCVVAALAPREDAPAARLELDPVSPVAAEDDSAAAGLAS